MSRSRSVRGNNSACTIFLHNSSSIVNKSCSGELSVSDHNTVPLGASTSWQVRRRRLLTRIREPVRMASTPASAAICRRSVVPANRVASRLERTIRRSIPESELLIASGRLCARNAVSSSSLSQRNGSAINRVTVDTLVRISVPLDAGTALSASSILRALEYRSFGCFAMAFRITSSNPSMARDPLSSGGSW